MNVIKEVPERDDLFEEKISKLATNNLTKLVNFWQILIKSIEEIRYAPNQEQAGSMAIIKLCYGSLLPDPSALLKQLSSPLKNDETKINVPQMSTTDDFDVKNQPQNSNNINQDKPHNFNYLDSFEAMLNLLLENKESLLHAQIINNVHLVSYSRGVIKVRLKSHSDENILTNLSNTLGKLTGSKWSISLSEEEGEKTIAEKKYDELEAQKNELKNSAEFSEVFKKFPDAEIISIEHKN